MSGGSYVRGPYVRVLYAVVESGGHYVRGRNVWRPTMLFTYFVISQHSTSEAQPGQHFGRSKKISGGAKQISGGAKNFGRSKKFREKQKLLFLLGTSHLKHIFTLI